MIVVDTSVLVDFFRATGSSQAKRLHEIEVQGIPFAIPMMCCQELLAGARNHAEWDLLLAYLASQNLLEPEDSWHAHREAARIMYDCRRQGITIRSSADCLVAQLTLDSGGTLLHADRDFEQIKRVRPLETIS